MRGAEPPPLGSGNRGYRKPAGQLFSQPRDTRGEAGKISLFHEEASIPGTHQSEEIGAWLSASVLYGVLQSTDACYVSEDDLKSVMPRIDPNERSDRYPNW